MTNNEIIKALKCCVFTQSCAFDEDKFYCHHGYSKFCDKALLDDALSLINRQEAEIEDWQGGYMTQKQEIANLEIELKAMRGAANSYKAEIERLTAENILINTNTTDITSASFLFEMANQRERAERFKQKWIAEIKAEAYKEFAEKSEKEIFIKQDNERKQMLEILKTYRGTRTYSDTERATDNWLRGYGEAVQDILSINDNLLKEMVGENDVNEKAKE